MARLFDRVLPLSQVSLQPPASFPELYQELWWYSGANTGTTSSNVAGNNFATKGAGLSSSKTATSVQLHTLSTGWSPSTKFAFEITLWCSGGTCYAALYDLTSSTLVSASQVSTTSTTATVLRSGQFTLTPGHAYGVTLWTSSTSYTTQLTDASLIIFPPAGSVSPSLSSISLANPSGGSLKEAYIPLYSYGSGTVTTSTGGAGALQVIQKGSTTTVAATSAGSPAKIHTLNANWSVSQRFALETSMYSASSTNVSAVASLYDFTAGSIVSASQVSLAYTTTATLLRSGSFTLTPNHVYGVTLGPSTNGNSVYLTKAHLVVLSS